MRILAEEALCRLPNVQRSQVDTPCGKAQGLVDEYKLNICLVSVVRSGKELVKTLKCIKIPNSFDNAFILQKKVDIY